MDFIPEQPESRDVPFYDDVTSEGGWQGHRTQKSLDKLQVEVTDSLTRLGATVIGFQRGVFITGSHKRDGFRIRYFIQSPDGNTSIPGQFDIAALPIKTDYKLRKTENRRRADSLKMALYMARDAIDGLWYLQQLSPGFAPLMPWLLASSENKTISQLWSESTVMKNLLPPGGSDFDVVEGEYWEN